MGNPVLASDTVPAVQPPKMASRKNLKARCELKHLRVERGSLAYPEGHSMHLSGPHGSALGEWRVSKIISAETFKSHDLTRDEERFCL
jgi:hypothetical protein